MNIIIKNLKKCFKELVAVNIAEYEIRKGDFLGLVGNNGAGKSTFFRLILDLIKADEGTIHQRGRQGEEDIDIDVTDTEDWKNWTAAYVDDGFLIDYLTPEEYFEFIAKISAIDKETLYEKLEKYAQFMNDEVLGKQKLIRNLSAGNRQKVGIIAALILEPDVLILDEPFNFLDPSSQHHLKQILKAYNEEKNATILLSSHNLTHTVDVCSRIALMEKGVIIKDIVNDHDETVKELEEYFTIQ